MGILKGSQEVLVIANNNCFVVIWVVNYFVKWVSDCAVYLHTFLNTKKNHVNFNFGDFCLLS